MPALRLLLAACGILVSFLSGMAVYVLTHPPGSETGRPVSAQAPMQSTHAQSERRWVRGANILIIGTDFPMLDPRFETPVSRADTLVLVNVNPKRGSIVAVSIPRDTRAQIPHVGVRKINDAYAYGGVYLTLDAVESLLDVPVRYYVQLEQQALVRFVDALGGIEILNARDLFSRDPWTGRPVRIGRGRQRLNGEMVLHYVRYRRDGLGDIGRVGRQQQILRVLFQKLKSPAAMARAPHLVLVFRDAVQTNLKAADLIALMHHVVWTKPGLQLQTLPGAFGQAYWEPDWYQIEHLMTVLQDAR